MSSLMLVAEAFRVVGEIVGELLSASQIDKWSECERKWGWRYVERLKEPAGTAALLGTECDDTQLQPYLRDGRPIDYSRSSGYVVQPGLPFLPAPRSAGIELQRHFVIPGGRAPSTFGVQGFVDLWVPDAGVMPPSAYDPKQGPLVMRDGTRPPVVADFKTTGNWKYQKHAKDLATDTQAQLYATWALLETGAPVVDLIWVYFATKGAYKAKRSHFRATRDHVAKQFERINEAAVTIHGHRQRRTNPLELAPNVHACGNYGGCPYEAKCNLSPSQKVDAAAASAARRMDTTMSSTAELLARLKSQAPASVAITPAPAPAPPPVTKAGIPVENLPAWATAPVDPLTGSSRPLGVNPPEKDLPPAPPVGSVAAPPPAAEAPKTRGPGRPKKDPVAADAAMHMGVTNVQNIVAPSGAERSVRVVWAQETFCPVAYNPFVVGPFEAIGPVLPGESYAEAHARIYADLVTFAENARAEKAISFQKTLAAFGGGK